MSPRRRSPKRTRTHAELEAIAAAAEHLLLETIRELNALRFTVSSQALLRLRDAVRGKHDLGDDDQYPLRRMVRRRAKMDI